MSLRPLFLILFVQGLGALAVWLARLPLPDAVIGMLLLFAYLAWSKRGAAEIEPTADTLLRYLPLFFVPASVGVMQYGALLAQHWLALAITLVVSVLATMLVTIGAARLAGRTL
jgi:holin-like protein